MREIHIVGNWKMNQTLSSIQTFFVEMTKMKMELRCHAWIAPQFIHFAILKELAFATGAIQVGVQNCSSENDGAFTGEVSANALQDMGAHFVIIGHSERRQIFKETDAELYKKVQQVLSRGMKVIFCVGETLEEREAGKTFEVVEKQMLFGLFNGQAAKFSEEEWANVMIAYEPVWAIGTGKTASADQAEEVHHFIRQNIQKAHGYNAESTIILYGGSVKPENVHEILHRPNIDGALVGGASLKPQDFKQLCMAGSQIRK
jgi:triosephosphate isomerase